MYTQKPAFKDPIVHSEEESVEDNSLANITWFKNVHQSGKVSFTEIQTSMGRSPRRYKSYYDDQRRRHREDGAAAEISYYLNKEGEWFPDCATWYEHEFLIQSVSYRADGTAWHVGWRESPEGDLLDTTDGDVLRLLSADNIE